MSKPTNQRSIANNRRIPQRGDTNRVDIKKFTTTTRSAMLWKNNANTKVDIKYLILPNSRKKPWHKNPIVPAIEALNICVRLTQGNSAEWGAYITQDKTTDHYGYSDIHRGYIVGRNTKKNTFQLASVADAKYIKYGWVHSHITQLLIFSPADFNNAVRHGFKKIWISTWREIKRQIKEYDTVTGQVTNINVNSLKETCSWYRTPSANSKEGLFKQNPGGKKCSRK